MIRWIVLLSMIKILLMDFIGGVWNTYLLRIGPFGTHIKIRSIRVYFRLAGVSLG